MIRQRTGSIRQLSEVRRQQQFRHHHRLISLSHTVAIAASLSAVLAVAVVAIVGFCYYRCRYIMPSANEKNIFSDISNNISLAASTQMSSMVTTQTIVTAQRELSIPGFMEVQSIGEAFRFCKKIYSTSHAKVTLADILDAGIRRRLNGAAQAVIKAYAGKHKHFWKKSNLTLYR